MDNRKTDWAVYYSKRYKASTYSRAITGNILVSLIKRNCLNPWNISIAELGGANSCFFELIRKEIQCSEYHIIDNYEAGLEMFKEKVKDKSKLFIHCQDVLNLNLNSKVDLVFSVGLIEHFTVEDTAKAVKGHFDILKPGGVAIITFPTPTILYRFTRFIAEGLGMWIFHDERPLEFEEVLKTASQYGTVLGTKIIYPIFLTQGLLILRKTKEPYPVQID